MIKYKIFASVIFFAFFYENYNLEADSKKQPNFHYELFLLHVYVLLYGGPDDVRTTCVHLYGSGAYMIF